jgi:short-subunit dehydrogenase
MNLVLVARREDRLRNLAEDLQSQLSISTRVVPVDLSQDDFLPKIEQATAGLELGLLVNNAGVATTGNFLDNDLAAELALLHINSRAPLILAHHLGGSMRKRRRGGMIFVSSTVAFAGVPRWSNYAASKAYDLVLAEGLANELHEDGISVVVLCPGPTRTEFWSEGAKPSSAMPPQAVVDVALKKLGRRTTVAVGWVNSITAFSTRFVPRSWNARIFGWALGGMLKRVDTHIHAQRAHPQPAASDPR